MTNMAQDRARQHLQRATELLAELAAGEQGKVRQAQIGDMRFELRMIAVFMKWPIDA